MMLIEPINIDHLYSISSSDGLIEVYQNTSFQNYEKNINYPDNLPLNIEKDDDTGKYRFVDPVIIYKLINKGDYNLAEVIFINDSENKRVAEKYLNNTIENLHSITFIN